MNFDICGVSWICSDYIAPLDIGQADNWLSPCPEGDNKASLHMRGTHLHEPGVQVSDFEWCLTDNAETQERGRFFLIILNLATIEVRDYLYFLRLPPPSLCRWSCTWRSRVWTRSWPTASCWSPATTSSSLPLATWPPTGLVNHLLMKADMILIFGQLI